MSAATQIVAEDEADIRLDRWMRRHFPGLQQSLIQKLCRTGQIRVDGKRAETNDRLAAGQSVRVPPLPTVVPLAVAPEEIVAVPNTLAALVVPPERTLCWPDADTTVALAVPPEDTSSTPASRRPVANSTRPDLSNTLSSARMAEVPLRGWGWTRRRDGAAPRGRCGARSP